jgi:protein-disulfide isomerase
VGGGYYWGSQRGIATGYRIGILRGEVRAARSGPPLVRNKGWSAAELGGAPPWTALGEFAEGEEEALAALLNQAPTPCFKLSRRGISLATSLLEPESACASAPEQTRLALVALRTFPDDAEEALAVLRIERRARPDVRGRPLRGNPDATIVVVEWGDFECAYCTRVQPLTHKLLEEMPEVGLAFKHYPLSFHPAAMPAALAVEAAAEQGRFWEMHDALFDLGKGIRDAAEADEPAVPFEQTAQELGLDIDAFRIDSRSEAVRDRVRSDMAEARSLGVQGTPTFFVGARKVEERLSVDMFLRLIERERGEQDWTFDWALPPVPEGGVDDPPTDAPTP